jgi:hypothetical protein
MAKKNHLLTKDQLKKLIRATEDNIVGISLLQENTNKEVDGDFKFISELYDPNEVDGENCPSTDDIFNKIDDTLWTNGNYVSIFLGVFVVRLDTCDKCYIEASDIIDTPDGIEGEYEIFKDNEKFWYDEDSKTTSATAELVLNRVVDDDETYYNFELAFDLTHSAVERVEDDYHDELEPVYKAIKESICSSVA